MSDSQTAQVIALLEQAGGKLVAEDDIVRTEDGTFAIPAAMAITAAADFLYRKASEDDMATEFDRTFPYRPFDGAIAMYRAMRRVFGMVHLSGRSPFDAPQMITVQTGVNESEQVPWGKFSIPVLPNVTFTVGATRDRDLGALFQVSAYGPRSDRHAINGVFAVIEDELRERSIYRGKAFDGRPEPKFIDVSSVDRSKVVYSGTVEDDMDASIWSLLRFSQANRDNGLPLKRAVLLFGPYGTGKTIGATLTAQIAEANGWTFINVRPGRDDIDDAMATARLYQPAVVFVEDVDTISDPQDLGRDGAMRLLDLFDGIDAKGTEILVVMTTNHPDRIHKGMLRPGRLDASIEIGALDADGYRRMCLALIDPANLAANVDWDAVANAMDGFLPAFVKEAIDRAKRYNLSHNDGRVTVIGTEDLVASAIGLRPQLTLMNAATDARQVDALADAFSAVMGEAVAVPIGNVSDQIEMVGFNVREIPIDVRRQLDGVAILRDESQDDGDNGDVVLRLDVDR